MAIHALSQHFTSFFRRLNPGTSFEATASSQYNTIKDLIENPKGPAAALSPVCFLQGSYRQQTAIYSINDVDIVTLCRLWQPGSGGTGTRSFGRNEIFDIVAAPLKADRRYALKVRYGPQSMCIKVDLGIKVEILPVVYKTGNNDALHEPFRLYRPEKADWEDGYARFHQQWLSWKNNQDKTGGTFIPMIKVMKHLRSLHGLNAVSFHIECLLFSLSDSLFGGSSADYIPAVLQHIARQDATILYKRVCNTPCGERDIFTGSEWTLDSWLLFHKATVGWALYAQAARDAQDKTVAIRLWRMLLGGDYFPEQPAT